ncbi:MAG: DUF2798 domain-containing protein [Comamonas sp.]|jgi:hypothetical protein
MISKRFAPVLFALFLSGAMSLLVSGVSAFRLVGPVDGFIANWASVWVTSWLFAFPVVLIVAPMARRIVDWLVCE